MYKICLNHAQILAQFWLRLPDVSVLVIIIHLTRIDRQTIAIPASRWFCHSQGTDNFTRRHFWYKLLNLFLCAVFRNIWHSDITVHSPAGTSTICVSPTTVKRERKTMLVCGSLSFFSFFFLDMFLVNFIELSNEICLPSK